MSTLYTREQFAFETFDNTRVAVVGYGSQGRSHALNLRDAGLDVTVGLRPGGPSWTQAESDGWTPQTVAEAVKGAQVVMLLAPDTAQPALFAQTVAPNLNDGALLLFAHGFNVHFGRLTPPDFVDVGLVAPKGPGNLVREQYLAGQGVPCLVAVHQDPTGRALARTLAYADALNSGRATLLGTTFAEETETDLFGEQAVLCGGVTELVKAGWETLVEAGYSPDVAYFECLHELKLIVDLLHQGGLTRMHKFVSTTASFGDLTRGRRVVGDDVRERMREVLQDVREGRFADEWQSEHESGFSGYETLLQDELNHPIESVGAALRQRMPWLHQEASA